MTGRCQCGSISYMIEIDAKKAYYCHCRMCQRAMGNVFGAFIAVQSKNFKWTSAHPKYFKSSSKAERGFCPDCGTPLCFRHFDSTRIHIAVGSLDQPDLVEPSGHTGIESRLRNFEWTDDLPKFETEKEQLY